MIAFAKVKLNTFTLTVKARMFGLIGVGSHLQQIACVNVEVIQSQKASVKLVSVQTLETLKLMSDLHCLEVKLLGNPCWHQLLACDYKFMVLCIVLRLNTSFNKNDEKKT